jgi:hypothetical protein
MNRMEYIEIKSNCVLVWHTASLCHAVSDDDRNNNTTS